MPPKKKLTKTIELVPGIEKPGFNRIIQTLDTDTQTNEIDLELIACLQKLNSLKESPNEK